MNKPNQTAVINIKMDAKLKREAVQLADEFGLTLSAMINALVKNVVRVKRINLSLNKEIPNEHTIEMLKKSREDYEKGNYISFKSKKELLKYFDNIISACPE